MAIRKWLLGHKKRPPRKDIIIKEDNYISLESFRSLRTNLQFAMVDVAGCKKVLVTSSLIREGKSTVVVNLGVSLASANKKTLIIDCDLRKPRLHKFVSRPCVPGLSDYLIGKAQINEVIVNYSENPNLDFVFAGVAPPNSTELLGSNEMKEFIAKLESSYDYILFDSPPVLSVSDSTILSGRTDGTLIIAKEGDTHLKALKLTIDNLKMVNAKILGIVLNNAKISKKKYYKYDYYVSKG